MADSCRASTARRQASWSPRSHGDRPRMKPASPAPADARIRPAPSLRRIRSSGCMRRDRADRRCVRPSRRTRCRVPHRSRRRQMRVSRPDRPVARDARAVVHVLPDLVRLAISRARPVTGVMARARTARPHAIRPKVASLIDQRSLTASARGQDVVISIAIAATDVSRNGAYAGVDRHPLLSASHHLAHVGEVAGDRGGGGHRRATSGGCGRRGPGGLRNCGSRSRRSARRARAGRRSCARHIEQPGSRHSKPASRKIRSRPSSSACCFTRPEPGTTIAPHAAGDLLAFDDLRRGAQVLDAAIGARADEDAVDLDVLQRGAGLEAHVVERCAPSRRACPRPRSSAGFGHDAGDRQHVLRASAPGDHAARCRRHRASTSVSKRGAASDGSVRQ